MYTLETVCFRYVSVNTLHKGDDDGDGDDGGADDDKTRLVEKLVCNLLPQML
jgi:hypothetical protein